MVLDITRYHLFNDGLSLFFLEAALTMASPSWFRSAGFLREIKRSVTDHSGSTLDYQRSRSCFTHCPRSRMFLFLLLAICSTLAATIGPASILLFYPVRVWMKATSTHFYIGGLDNNLWPMKLNGNHTGHKACALSPLRMEFSSCLYASLTVLMGAATLPRPVHPGFIFCMPGGAAYQFPPANLIVGNIPTPDRNYTFGDPDTWAVARHLAVKSHMPLLNDHTNKAFAKSTQWRRRPRASGGTRIVPGEAGKFPVVRTVCSDRKAVTGPQSKLDVPILNNHGFWRTRNVTESTGPLAQIDFAVLSLTDWDALESKSSTTSQSRARWFPLPPNFGVGSAVSVQLVQNSTATNAYTCIVDAR